MAASSYSVVSSVSLDDDISLGSTSSLIEKNGDGSPQKSSKKTTTSLSANELFLRKQYLETRAKKLRKRLEIRPFDERALVEFAEVTYEQKNFLVSQKIIRRVMAIGEPSGYWYLKLGKCCFRRWLVYAQPNGPTLLSFSFSLLVQIWRRRLSVIELQ
jgi:hypothetical protein